MVASVYTEHWFATPFAFLFFAGYSYVATLVISEQLTRRREALAFAHAERISSESMPVADVQAAGVARAA